MAEENDIRIISWPESPATVRHELVLNEPIPVGVSFADKPANVVVSNSPKQPLNVNMNMILSALKRFPVCLSVCEPICIKSGYSVQISIFDRPVVSITVKGQTVISSCDVGV